MNEKTHWNSVSFPWQCAPYGFHHWWNISKCYSKRVNALWASDSYCLSYITRYLEQLTCLRLSNSLRWKFSIVISLKCIITVVEYYLHVIDIIEYGFMVISRAKVNVVTIILFWCRSNNTVKFHQIHRLVFAWKRSHHFQIIIVFYFCPFSIWR